MSAFCFYVPPIFFFSYWQNLILKNVWIFFLVFLHEKERFLNKNLCDGLHLQENPYVHQPFKDGDKHGFSLLYPPWKTGLYNGQPPWWDSGWRVGRFISRSPWCCRTTTHMHTLEQTPKENPQWHCLRSAVTHPQCVDWTPPSPPQCKPNTHAFWCIGPLEAEPCSLFVHCISPSRMAFILSLALYLSFLPPTPPHPVRAGNHF